MPDTRSGSERCGQPDQTADEIRTIVADRAFLRLCPENGPEWSESAAQWAQQEADAIANAVYQSLDFDVAPASPGDEGQRQRWEGNLDTEAVNQLCEIAEELQGDNDALAERIWDVGAGMEARAKAKALEAMKDAPR